MYKSTNGAWCADNKPSHTTTNTQMRPGATLFHFKDTTHHHLLKFESETFPSVSKSQTYIIIPEPNTDISIFINEVFFVILSIICIPPMVYILIILDIFRKRNLKMPASQSFDYRSRGRDDSSSFISRSRFSLLTSRMKSS